MWYYFADHCVVEMVMRGVILYAGLLCISFFWVPTRRMTIGSHMRRTRGGQTMTATTHGTQITTAGVNIGMAGLFSIDMLCPL